MALSGAMDRWQAFDNAKVDEAQYRSLKVDNTPVGMPGTNPLQLPKDGRYSTQEALQFQGLMQKVHESPGAAEAVWQLLNQPRS